jgi:hypothetical protein
MKKKTICALIIMQWYYNLIFFSHSKMCSFIINFWLKNLCEIDVVWDLFLCGLRSAYKKIIVVSRYNFFQPHYYTVLDVWRE